MHPNAKWWIKADGCDVVSGLEESVRLEWHGDVDYGNSEVQLLYNLYRHRLKVIDQIASVTPVQDKRRLVIETLQQEQSTLCVDVNFIGESEALHVFIIIYEL